MKGVPEMKKILCALMVLCMVLPLAAFAEAPAEKAVDAFTSASVVDY